MAPGMCHIQNIPVMLLDDYLACAVHIHDSVKQEYLILSYTEHCPVFLKKTVTFCERACAGSSNKRLLELPALAEIPASPPLASKQQS